MPTGYTADVQTGTITEFNDFVWRCARGMGALIMMRDDPWDAPIPERFEPFVKYHDDRIATARATIDRLVSLTKEQAAAEAAQAYDTEVREAAERDAERLAQRARYDAMIEKVNAWTPPTDDHNGMKEFMLQQLNEGKRFDTDPYPRDPVVRKNGERWLSDALLSAHRDVAYHIKARTEEVNRTDGRNRWVADLRASLAETVTP